MTRLSSPRTRAGLPPAADSMPVVVRDLAKRFPSVTALAGASFDVRPGEVLGLLGPNGAGKTTTLHILLGVVRPSGGSVRLFGHDPHDGTKRALRRVGFASPEALMDWRLTVEENLRVYAALYGVGRSAIARAIEMLEMGELARSRFGDLSLGQQTRAVERRVHAEVLGDAQAPIHERLRRCEAHPAQRRLGAVVRIVPEQSHVTGARPDDPEQHVERRRLAGAVRPEQPQHFARTHVERHAVERGCAREALGEVADLHGQRVANRRQARRCNCGCEGGQRASAFAHRRSATSAQTASTTPNGHAPCKKPYAEPSPHETAKPRMNHRLRCSKA